MLRPFSLYPYVDPLPTQPLGRYGMKIVTPPDAEPIDLTTAKNWLRVDHTADDTLITWMISMVREMTESYARRAWVTRSVEFTLSSFPVQAPIASMTPIEFPLRPLQSVTSITYIDTNGVSQPFTNFTVWPDSTPPFIGVTPGNAWPGVQAGQLEGVTIEAVIGYGEPGSGPGLTSAIPNMAVMAMLMALTHFYENRGDKSDPHKDHASFGLPPAATNLLDRLTDRTYL